MGQKVHPYGFRLGVAKDWTSTWYVETKDYAHYLNMDLDLNSEGLHNLMNSNLKNRHFQTPNFQKNNQKHLIYCYLD